MSQKFHGISLANNSTADNFHFERVTNDPAVVKPGRVWFNETQKLFKFSGLDNNGDVVINVFTSGSEMVATITLLQAALTTETNERTTAINDLVTALAAEQTARIAADTATTSSISGVSDSVTAETTRATTAENTLTTNLAAEVAARTAADTALQTTIDNLVLAGDSGALKTALNAGRFTFTSPTAELEHVIVHNLNTEYFLSDIKVQGVDLVYRNDICPVEEIDNNSFRITLTEAAKVKVGVMSLATIV